MQQPLRERLQFGNAAHLAAVARLEELQKLLTGSKCAFTRRTWRGQMVKPRACVRCKQLIEHVSGVQHVRQPGGRWSHAICFAELERELEGLKARFL